MKKDASGSVRLTSKIQEAIEAGELDANECSHLSTIQDVIPSADGCEDCLKIGDSWVHLRLCLTCGHVGCCDDSKNKHATRHHHETSHPVIASYEEGEDWIWCFVDQVGFVP
jgi:uncharacterized UBP type Zn finger protein